MKTINTLVTTVLLALLLFGCSDSDAQVSANFSSRLLASAAQTATVNTADQTNLSWKGGHVIVNVTAYTSGTFTPHVQGKDPVSGVYYDICVGPAIGATGLTRVSVYPGINVVANVSCSDLLPKTWRVSMVGASTPIATFSVGYFGEY